MAFPARLVDSVADNTTDKRRHPECDQHAYGSRGLPVVTRREEPVHEADPDRSDDETDQGRDHDGSYQVGLDGVEETRCAPVGGPAHMHLCRPG